MAKNKAAAVVAAVMTVVVTVVRILLIPKLTLPESGWWRWSYLAILLLVATVAAVFALGRFPKGEERRSIAGKPMLVTAVAGVLCGSLLTVVAVFDAGNWLFYEKTPPPNEEVISRLDAIALALMLLAGLLAGIAMVRCWFIWIGAGRTRSGIMRVWMLAPVLWAWLRLARYEMSYASAVDVTRNFYDFMMMIFELLFFFALARYVSGVGTKLPRALPALALCTGAFSLSGPVTQLAMRLNEEGIRYTAGSMATVTDFVIGAFALLMAFALIWKGQPDGTEDEATADETREDAAQETPESEKWEEIVGELTGPHSVLGAPADSKIPQDLSNSWQETERGS